MNMDADHDRLALSRLLDTALSLNPDERAAWIGTLDEPETVSKQNTKAENGPARHEV